MVNLSVHRTDTEADCLVLEALEASAAKHAEGKNYVLEYITLDEENP